MTETQLDALHVGKNGTSRTMKNEAEGTRQQWDDDMDSQVSFYQV